MINKQKTLRHRLHLATDNVAVDREAMFQSGPGQSFLTDVQAQINLIHDLTDASSKIDDLVDAEMFLQSLDLKTFTAESDLKSVNDAHHDYTNMGIILNQMQKNPLIYMDMNVGTSEANGDPTKICRSFVLKHLDSNRKRMNARIAGAPETIKNLYRARLELINKTEDVYKEMHAKIASEWLDKKIKEKEPEQSQETLIFTPNSE
jgi:hypothetical protein